MRTVVGFCLLAVAPIALAQENATQESKSDDVVVFPKSLRLHRRLPPATDLTGFGRSFQCVRVKTLKVHGATTIAEPHLAVRHEKHLLVGNVFAAISTDHGKSYRQISMPKLDEGELGVATGRLGAFCCDQVVHEKNGYFYWIAQHENGLRLSVIASDELESGSWNSYALMPGGVSDPERSFDFNSMFSTNKDLIVLTRRNRGPQKHVHPSKRKNHVPIAIRIPLCQLEAGEPDLRITMFQGEPNQTFCGAAGTKDDRAIFVSHSYNDSEYLIKVYEWSPDAGNPETKTAAVSPWSDQAYSSVAPDGGEWLSRIDGVITAAWITYTDNRELLGVAWTADGRESGIGVPHVRCAVLDIACPGNVVEAPLWNPRLSFAYPAVAVDSSGKPAFCLSVGGRTRYPSHAVATLVGLAEGNLKWKVSVVKRGSHSPVDRSWGDYLGIVATPDDVFHSVSHVMQGGRLNRDAEISYAAFCLDRQVSSSPEKHFYAYLDLKKERATGESSFGTKDFIDLLPRLSKAGYNAVVISDYHLCDLKRLGGVHAGSDVYLRNLEQVRQAAAKHEIELIPEVMSVGSSGQILLNNAMLAEGAGVLDSEFVVFKKGGEYFARLKDGSNKVESGEFDGLTKAEIARAFVLDGPDFELSDETRSGAGKSLALPRLEKTGFLQQRGIQIKKHHQYEWSFWAKHSSVRKAAGEELVFYSNVHAAEEETRIPLHRVGHTFVDSRDEWHQYVAVFNSFKFESVDISIGLEGATDGTLYLDDIQLRESQAVNLLQRDDLPIVVKTSNGTVLDQKYYEICRNDEVGKYGLYSPEDAMLPIRIKDNEKAGVDRDDSLFVSYYHAQLPNVESHRVCCSLTHPKVLEIHREQIRLLDKLLRPRRWFVNYDEIRGAGHEPAAKNRTPGQLLRQHLVKCLTVIRDHGGNKPVILNADMFNPFHNAVEPGHPRSYYPMVNGGFKGSWLPISDKEVASGPEITYWNWALADQDPRKFGEQVASSYRHFRDLGYSQIVGGFVDVPREVVGPYIEDHFRLAKRHGGPISATSYYTAYRDLCLLGGFVRLTDKVWPATERSDAIAPDGPNRSNDWAGSVNSGGKPNADPLRGAAGVLVGNGGNGGIYGLPENVYVYARPKRLKAPTLEFVGDTDLSGLHRISAAVSNGLDFLAFDDKGPPRRFRLEINSSGELIGFEDLGMIDLRKGANLQAVESVAKLNESGTKLLLGFDRIRESEGESRPRKLDRSQGVLRVEFNPRENSITIGQFEPGLFKLKDFTNNGIEAGTGLGNGCFLFIEEMGTAGKRNAWILSPQSDDRFKSEKIVYDYSRLNMSVGGVSFKHTDVGGAARLGNDIYVLHKKWDDKKKTNTVAIVRLSPESRELLAIAHGSVKAQRQSAVKLTPEDEPLFFATEVQQPEKVLDNFEAIVALVHDKARYIALISDDNVPPGERADRSSRLLLFRISDTE